MLSFISKKWLALIVVLVAGLGLTVGYILIPLLEPTQTASVLIPTNNTTINNSTATNTTGPSVNTSNQNIISPSQAVAIANKYAASFGEEASGGADYYNGIGDYHMANGDPYYHVELKNIKTTNYGNSDDIPKAWYVEIDANTGAINPRG